MSEKQIDNNSKPWLFKPGQSGNPKGRPKGKTIKEQVMQWLEKHPDDMKSFIKHFAKKNRELTWQMLEGRPAQKTDLTSGGEKITPIYGGQSVHGHNSDEKDIQPDKEN